MKTFMRISALALLLGGIISSLKAQVPEKEQAYYIDINAVQENVVYEIMDKKLNVTYNDRYGRSKDILFRIFDWKHDLVASLKMDKAQGLNSYRINLGDIYSGWQLDHVYTAELKDERGRPYRLPIRLVEPPDDIAPVADIFVNPIHVSCDGLSPNSVEFYGNITGGRAPFSVHWYVLNSARTDFLFQPKEEIVESVGRTSQISVDKSPEYYVVLYVKDACGKEDKKVVNLVCQTEQKKINTIFLEELVSPVFKGIKSVQ